MSHLLRRQISVKKVSEIYFGQTTNLFCHLWSSRPKARNYLLKLDINPQKRDGGKVTETAAHFFKDNETQMSLVPCFSMELSPVASAVRLLWRSCRESSSSTSGSK